MVTGSRKLGLTVTVLVLLAAVVAVAALRPFGGAPRPDIIVIVVDTLRPDHLGCYGSTLDTSPNVDALAADSMFFEDCRAHAPNTRMSMASVFSGFLPHETNVVKQTDLTDKVETLAEQLIPLGYTTAAVISNFVLRKGVGFDQGFMVYDDEMKESEQTRKLAERTAEPTTDRAIELLRKYKDEQLFMWIHYQDPHGPYTPPPGYGERMKQPGRQPRLLPVTLTNDGLGGIPRYQRLGEHRDYHHYVANYNGEIRHFDEHFGRLIAALKELGYYDDALIIFTSDHGEGMGEQNWYFAHGTYLYSSITRVPLMLRYGDRLPKVRRTQMAQHLDIMPTIRGILELANDRGYRGRDLRGPLASGPEVFAEARPGKDGKRRVSLIADGMKLIVMPVVNGQDRLELYDLNEDPYEAHDLGVLEQYEATRNALALRVNEIMQEDRLGIELVGAQRPRTKEELEKLKDIGYSQ